ncbi:non-ribosomal peptide synthetase [Acrocarpospora catenulata]|uniref:non-ribosomal peptide synthetase n=1 Tax=Acrocarpospora catenulata TaxID=2836182 RepID=UPI001BD989D2|nr:non-ribosomal peptide synthetase [Acrocarpospora catenulata]
MSVSTTLAPDVAEPARPTYARGSLTRSLDGRYGADPLAVLAAAVQALIAGPDAEAVAVVAVSGGGLRGLRSPLGEGTRIGALLDAADGEIDPEARVVVAVDADRAEVERLALALPGCDCVFLLYGDADGWSLECDYDADRYGAPTMEWHLDRLESILELLETDPGAPLYDVMVAPEALADDDGWQERAYVAPRTPTEEALAAIWAEVLQVDKVGAEDDFFALGGHSILAARVLTRIRAVFGVDVHFDQLFAAPTLAACARAVSSAATGAPAHPLAPVPAGEAVASLEQERLWFLDQWRPGTALYNVPVLLELTGQVDPARLRAAVQRVADRHPALRTAFAPVDGRPEPYTAPADVPWSEATAATWEQAGALADERLREPFDLTTPPLIKAGLVSHTTDRHLLWISIHHIAVDGWSLTLLLDDLTAAYQDEPLSGQGQYGYAEYAAWQRATLTGPALDAGLTWWRGYLDGLPPLLDLPADRRRPAVQSFAGGTTYHQVPPELAAALAEFARSCSATAFDVGMAVFALLVRRWTGHTDLAVATPVAGRPLPELESLVGFFVNTLVIRTDLTGDPTFRELVDRVRHSAAGALSHQDIPFSALVEALRPERDLAYGPLAQLAFAHYRPSPYAWPLTGELDARLRPADTGTAKFDLTLTLHDNPDGMVVAVEYAEDLFEAATADRLAEQWLTLLRGLLADPVAPVSRITELPAHQRRVVVDWAGELSGRPLPPITELVARRVRERPDAVAVRDGDTELTYGQLWARAGALASLLGPSRGDLVGLACHRGADLVVGMLGILRAGAAYVPLDPAYPVGRLAFMLEDTGARRVVGHRDLLAKLPLDGRTGIDVREAAEADAPEVATTPDDAAYVIYTSGSTGRPKGVVVQHRGITRLVEDTDYVTLDESTVLAQLSNASFDAITFEVWGALAAGGQIVVVPPEAVLSPPALAGLLRDTGVTTVFITTALFNAATGEVPDAFATVAQLYFGGEALDVARVAEVLRGGQGPRALHNIYGPTEVTTFSTYQPLTEPPATRGPIGGPIADTTAWVVELGTGDLAPVGVPGELWLGGPGVACGYWGRPGHTARSFVPDPFSGTAGARLYRTGDLVRWTSDGTLEFLGRIDHQLKIRGFRVELGEVELALSALPQVRACAVVALQPEGGPVELVGYVQPRAGADVVALREALAGELPDHLIPAHLILVDRLPLNPNGKIDTAALPAPRSARAGLGLAPPEGPVEQLLAEVWAEVLGRAELGAEDDFFELGGHSLDALKVTTRIERALRTPLSVRELFQHKTVRRLAAALRERDADRMDRVARVVLAVRSLTPEEREARLRQGEENA